MWVSMCRASTSRRPERVNSARIPSARRMSSRVKTSRQRGTFSIVDRSAARAAAAITASELFFAPATRKRPRSGRPPSISSRSTLVSWATSMLASRRSPHLRVHVTPHQFFEQPPAVELPDQSPGVPVARDVRRVAGDEVPDDLVGRVIPALPQRVKHVSQDLTDVPHLMGADLEDPRLLMFPHTSPLRPPPKRMAESRDGPP